MNLQEKSIGNVLVVTPQENRIDALVATDFKGRLVDLINQGHGKIVLNMNHVDFMDSSGLTAIISTFKTVSSTGGELVVCSLGSGLVSLFKLTKLDKVFQVFPSEDLACKALE